jgi:hypothetical protein
MAEADDISDRDKAIDECIKVVHRRMKRWSAIIDKNGLDAEHGYALMMETAHLSIAGDLALFRDGELDG